MYKSENYVRYDEYDEKEIRNLLIGRKIARVENVSERCGTLVLDNGERLMVEANEGCGGCSNGWYYLKQLNDCDNVITDVEFLIDDECEDDGYSETSYKIFVYAENKKIKILQVDGDDGNGYYGSGYSIVVKR